MHAWKATVADWKLFREKVLEWYAVDVPEHAFDVSLLNP